MENEIGDAAVRERPGLVRLLAWYAIFGCILFSVMILIADFVVP
ncbi:MAG TPA: DUF998 domain-containing protein, partial [Sulfitobacter pontiacus]|nr:DUF998 domain-containing protein [Sulfitobacter pontiacus]